MARVKPREVPRSSGGSPPELRTRLHPIWKDHAAVVERFREYLSPTEVSSDAGRNIYFVVLRGWAIEHGYESQLYPGTADFHALTRAGVIRGPR